MKKRWIAVLGAAMAMLLLAAGCDNGMTAAMAAVIAGQQNEQKPVAVEGIALDMETLTLKPGTEWQLTATVTPSNASDKTVTWSSSNDWVAEVDENGMVSAVGTGFATIYAQAGDKTATCRVTVKNIFVEVERVTISEETLTLKPGDTATLTATVEPDNADDKTAMWSSSNTAVAEVDENGMVTAVGIGTTTITASAGNKRATCLVTVGLPDAEAEGFVINVNGTLTKYTGTDTDVTIPDGVRAIWYDAFYGCTSLASVTIPKGVTEIGGIAFYGCTSLTSVTIPKGVTEIGWFAFHGCTSLATVTYQGTLAQWKEIQGSNGVNATCVICTDGYLGVKDVPPYLTMTGTEVTGCTGELPENLVIPEGVRAIGYNAFEGCTSLASVTIPESVTSIGYSAFKGCTSLATVTYQGTLAQWKEIQGSNGVNATCVICTDGYLGVKDVPPYLTMTGTEVTGCTGELPENLVIPEGVRAIGDNAFKGCTSLASVTIPEGVTSIGYGAFDGCTSLVSVTIPASVKTMTTGLFGSFYDCTSLDTVYYGGTLTQWCALDGISTLMNYAKHVIIDGTDLKQAKTLDIPDGVTAIGYYAFEGCTSLTSVRIPDSVTSIGNGAFYECTSLASVTIPNGVTSIGNYAFYKCTSLTTINYTGTEEQWNAITKGSDWDKDAGGYTITYNYTE